MALAVSDEPYIADHPGATEAERAAGAGIQPDSRDRKRKGADWQFPNLGICLDAVYNPEFSGEIPAYSDRIGGGEQHFPLGGLALYRIYGRGFLQQAAEPTTSNIKR